jgi:hypothetical protein
VETARASPTTATRVCNHRGADNLYFRLWEYGAVLIEIPVDVGSRNLAGVCRFVYGVIASAVAESTENCESLVGLGATDGTPGFENGGQI